MDVFIARQPIFDRKQKVIAYELLYRGREENWYENLDGDAATSNVVTNAFLLLGIDSLTEGKKAFINFTEKLLKNEIPTLFPQESIVVEILEDINPDDKLIKACKHLKEQGYVLALDDFVVSHVMKFRKLIPLVDIIKVDFRLNSDIEKRVIVEKLGQNRNIQFLAEKIETREEFNEALDMGYRYFQGYFFEKPIIVRGQDVSVSKLNCIQVMNEVSRPEPRFELIAEIIEKDVSMSYKLLRLVNSFASYTGGKITSIQHALVYLGLREVKKWVSLIMLRDIVNDEPNEVVKISLIRGRFNELLAGKAGLAHRKSEAFLTGLFSMIDVLMNRPLPELLRQMPLSNDVKVALLGGENEFGQMGKLVFAYEKGEWDTAAKYTQLMNLEEKDVAPMFVESLRWTNEIFDVY